MIYNNIYDILITHIFGGTLTPEMELAATLISMCASIAFVALPLVFVYAIIMRIFRI